jgi:hypothetical protein
MAARAVISVFAATTAAVYGAAPGIPTSLDEYQVCRLGQVATKFPPNHPAPPPPSPQCIYHHGRNAKGYAYSWDLAKMMNGGSKYTAHWAPGEGDPAQSMIFNLCGPVPDVCAPEFAESMGALPPFTHGMAIMVRTARQPTHKHTHAYAHDNTRTVPFSGSRTLWCRPSIASTQTRATLQWILRARRQR